MQRTRVEVWDSDLNDVEGSVYIDSAMTYVYRGSKSLPIEVSIFPGCDTEVILNIEVDTRALHGAEATINSAERVLVQPSEIKFVPWKYYDFFEVSVDNEWDTTRPNSFYLKYSLTSTDAQAFKLPQAYTDVQVWYENEIETTVTGFSFRQSGGNAQRNKIQNMQISTDGSGTIQYVVLPYKRQKPTA